MDNFKRVLAWIAIIILGGMYLVTLIVSIVSSKDTMVWVWSSVYVTVVVSVLSYALILIHNNMTKKRDEERDRALRFSMAMREQVNKKKEEDKKKAEEEKARKEAEKKAREIDMSRTDGDSKSSPEKINEMIGEIRKSSAYDTVEGTSENVSSAFGMSGAADRSSAEKAENSTGRLSAENSDASKNLSAVPGLYKLVRSGALTVEKAAEAADMSIEQFKYEVKRMGLE